MQNLDTLCDCFWLEANENHNQSLLMMACSGCAIVNRLKRAPGTCRMHWTTVTCVPMDVFAATAKNR